MASDSLLSSINLVFDPQGPALICKTCQYALAVSKSQVTTHLWKKHGILAGSRRDVTLLIRSFVIPNPAEIAPRADHSLIRPHLKLFHGYACVNCQYRSINLDMMTRHVSSCCPPPNPPSRQRRNPDTLYQDVLLQTWVSGARKYWIVRGAATCKPLQSFSSSSYLEAIHERERAHVIASEREAMKETGSKELELTSLWMERTQWAYVYDGAERGLLARITQVERKNRSHNKDFVIGEHQGAQLVSGAADELKISRLMAALDRALDRCEETMRRTGHPILCWLNTSSRNRFDQRPFAFLGRAATRQRYRRLSQRFLPFLFRAYNMAAAVRLSALGIRFTKKELTELEKVWNDEAWDEEEYDVANGEERGRFRYDNDLEWESGCEDNEDEDDDEHEVDEEEEEDEEEEGKEGSEGDATEHDNETRDGGLEDGCTTDTGEDDDETPQTSDDIHAPVDKLAELVFRLSIFFITEEFTNGQPSSNLLVYYSGVLGFSDDGSTFRRAKDYTPQLSALIYIQRLLLLEFALPFRAYTYVCLPRRPPQGHFEILDNVRLKCMVLGCLTPLGEFISLRSRGRKLALADPPSFLARWSDDGHVLSYGDTSISMGDFRRFGHSLVQQAEALCQSLMFNWLPEVDLNNVKDDMSITTRGYSFVQHPANGLSLEYLKLSTRVCMAQGNGLLRGDRWDYKAVADYLKSTESLQKCLAGIMYCLGGQAPRVTELFSLECCNGQSSQCGIYVYNGYMIYVIRHHKAKRSTNNEFIVVRFLPARPGKLLYYYLVYIRLVAAMFYRETSMRKTRATSNLLFCSLDEPELPWPSSRMTDILKKNSNGIFEKPIHIRLYRQLSICVTEKHVKRLAKPFNRYDDQSADADPSVVFAWQSGHRPRHRDLNYGWDGAFPSKLQPALLNIYEWASIEWHQFLGHQSRVCTSLGAYQQQFVPANESFEVPSDAGLLNPKGYAVGSYYSWQSSHMGPRIAAHNNTPGCRFLPPVTQKSFAIPGSGFQTHPLNSISTNYNCYPTGMGPGLKRKHDTIPIEDGGGDVRKRRQKPGPLYDSIYLSHRELAAANAGILPSYEESRYTSISRRNDMLTEIPGQHINASRKGVTKTIPIWVDEDDSWSQTEFENDGETRNQTHATGGKFQVRFDTASTDIGTLKLDMQLMMSPGPAEIRLDDTFHYDADYKVLICKYHGQGVVGFERHLKDAHNIRNKRDRLPFLERFAGLEIAKPQDVVLPPMNGPPFKALKAPVIGFSCIKCGHLFGALKGMQRHCNTEHNWHVSKQDPIHWQEVMVQTFFRGSNIRYFTVRVESDIAPRT